MKTTKEASFVFYTEFTYREKLTRGSSITSSKSQIKMIEKEIKKRKQEFGVEVFEHMKYNETNKTRAVFRKAQIEIEALEYEIKEIEKKMKKMRNSDTQEEDEEDLDKLETQSLGSTIRQNIIAQYAEEPKISLRERLFASCFGRKNSAACEMLNVTA
eukprot:snap_masked-scaffold_3-processed-gene-21.52-mRNA-1 protein AED:0.44 eAED:1.00 QI:0/0/0/1/1/1/2/0/157